MSEERVLAILLNTMGQACGASARLDKFDSMALSAYAKALRELRAHGLVEIENETGRQVIANLTAKGKDLIERYVKEEWQG